MNKVKKINNILYCVEKDFPITGVNFIDLTPTLTTKNHFEIVSQQLKKEILKKDFDFDYIVCPDARGFLWGAYIASLLAKPLIPIRKHGKLPPNSIMSSIKDKTEYSNIELDLPNVDLKNKKCIFIDDVYATGGTYKACKKLIENNEGIMKNAYVIINIELNDDDVISLITINDIEIN